MRTRALIAVATALAAALSSAGWAEASELRLPTLHPSERDGLTRALEAGEISDGRYALDRATALFSPATVAARYGPLAASGPRAATLVLRDLAVRLHELAPDERREAEALLTRPDAGSTGPAGIRYAAPSRVDCTPYACVHWVEVTADAPPLVDSDGDTIPDQVELAKHVIEQVWLTEIGQLGYREPKSDQTSQNGGPDGRLDVYLADTGRRGLYGYCTSDDPALSTLRLYGDVSAYCVLDDDFSPAQFPGDPVELLKVTAAHELFHAVQFAYDFFDDLWFMESTAVWVEDEVYDGIDDHRQFLESSQLTHPEVPLDLAGRDAASGLAGFHYGAFLFWRFLSERYGADVIRAIWEQADASPSAPDRYSTRAADTSLEGLGSSLQSAFAAFGAANVSPSSSYEEGATYPVPRPSRRTTLSTGRQEVRGNPAIDHLASWYRAFEPGKGTGPAAKLRVELDLPGTETGAAATLIIGYRSGAIRRVPVALDGAGNGSRTVPFSRRRVARVTLVLSNGSSRFSCWAGTVFSCRGIALDDGRRYRYAARLVRPS